MRVPTAIFVGVIVMVAVGIAVGVFPAWAAIVLVVALGIAWRVWSWERRRDVPS